MLRGVISVGLHFISQIPENQETNRIFGDIKNFVLEENGEDKMIRESN